MTAPRPNFDFDIDHYLNRYVPRNRLGRLPKPISWFLGHRGKHPVEIGTLLIYFWAFVGAFAGLLVVEAVFNTPFFKNEGTPIVVASFGAAAILEYNAIASPLAQPRPAFLGQLLSAVIGISIHKLFSLSPHYPSPFSNDSNFLVPLAGALAVGIASALMGFTKTVHPPAGATALLCVVDAQVARMGWWFLVPVMIGTLLLLGVALLINNLQRRWPIWWWTEHDLRSRKDDLGTEKSLGSVDEERDAAIDMQEAEPDRDRLVVGMDRVVLPQGLELNDLEISMLEGLRTKMKEGRRRRESEATRVGSE
ncbi:HPP family-domain-containing protein [Bisporella sp. PMI_857]|nr:HPP family-domain-containing protein [Bisporella sp. PMI_857]